MKRIFALKINFWAWFLATVIMMVLTYHKWSQYGEYTFISFIVSLIFYGGGALVGCFISQEFINKYHKDKEEKYW